VSGPVAVTVHGPVSSAALGTDWPLGPIAVRVRGVLPDSRVGRALASVDASWPEHYYWALRAFDRGDVWVTEVGPDAGDVWFFEGEAGAELAGL
jgi:hypothetical protein